jgi:hypothetical protein
MPFKVSRPIQDRLKTPQAAIDTCMGGLKNPTVSAADFPICCR